VQLLLGKKERNKEREREREREKCDKPIVLYFLSSALCFSLSFSSHSALAKFGVKLPAIRPSIITLLRRTLHDGDDEVRDRATLCLRLLEKMQTEPEVTTAQIIVQGM
jgi:hypothetical protein